MNDEQLLRYSRQLMLPQMDVAGQEKLLAARVLIVGLGGLGCPVAMYLAAAGVGHLLLADDDVVELSNLQRQIAHTNASIGRPKVASAQDTVQALNPDVGIELFEHRLGPQDLESLLPRVDLVVDATDNFATRFLLNRHCHAHRVPLVSGAAIRMEGQITVYDFSRADSPCYECLYEAAEDGDLNCSQNGVLAPMVGIIGTMQAMEAVKVLTGMGKTLHGRLLVIDGLNMELRELRLQARPGCPVCGSGN